MNILGISLSPRKYGNTECYLKYILNKFEHSKNTISFLRLYDFDIKPCKACSKMYCLTDKKCIIDDDLQLIVTNLARADVLIIGSPTYCSNVSPIFLNLNSRWFAIAKYLSINSGKIAAYFSINGEKQEYESHINIATLAHFLVTSGYKIVYCERINNIRFRGEILLESNIDQMSEKFVQSLIQNNNFLNQNEEVHLTSGDKNFYCCSICGSSNFIIYKNGIIKCTSCFNTGKILNTNISFNKLIFHDIIEREKHLMRPIKSAKESQKKIKDLLLKREDLRQKTKNVIHIRKIKPNKSN